MGISGEKDDYVRKVYVTWPQFCLGLIIPKTVSKEE